MAGLPPKSIIQDLVTALHSNSFSAMENSVNNIIAEGYPVPTIISMLFDVVVKDQNASDSTKADVCIRIAETDKNLVDGANDVLQLMNVSCLAMRCFAKDARGAVGSL